MASTGEYTLTLFQHAAQLVGYALVEALRELQTSNDNLEMGIHKTQGQSLIDIPLLAVMHLRPEFKTAMAEWMTSSVVFERSIHKMLAYIRMHPSLANARAFYANEIPRSGITGNRKLLDGMCGTFDELYATDRVKSPYFAALFPDNDAKLDGIIRLPILASLTDPLPVGVNAKKAIFAAVHGLLVAKFVFDVIPEYQGVLPVAFDSKKTSVTLADLILGTDAHILTLIGTKLTSESLPVKVLAPTGSGDEESDVGGAVAVRSISQDPDHQNVTPTNIPPKNVSVAQLADESLKPFRKSVESTTKLQAFLHLFRQRPMPDEEPLQYYQLQLIIGIAQYTKQYKPLSIEELEGYVDREVVGVNRNPIALLKRSKNVIVVFQDGTPASAPEGELVMTQLATGGPPLPSPFRAIPSENDNDYKDAMEVLKNPVDWELLKMLAAKRLLDLSDDAEQRKAAMEVFDENQPNTWTVIRQALDDANTLSDEVSRLKMKLKKAKKGKGA